MNDANYQLFATCAKGLEPLLFDELEHLGVEGVQQTVTGCHFTADLKQAYNVCLWSRLASRVLLQLGTCAGTDVTAMTKAVAQTPWPSLFAPTAGFAVDFNGSNRVIRHTQFGAQVVKDGIVDAFRDAGLERPSVQKDQPDIRIRAHLHKDQLTWFLDLSGESLHRRGYRQQQGAAPLRETLAAAIAIRAGVNQQTRILLDPFCGSGTLLFESAMIVLDRAPGLTREQWGFQAWSGHDQDLWQQQLAAAQQRYDDAQANTQLKIYGRDRDTRMLAIADQNAHRLGVQAYCDWQKQDAEKLVPITDEVTAGEAILLGNPPYGERLGEEVETFLLYRRFGQVLRQHFAQWHVAIVAGDESLLKRLKLRSHKKYKLFNGAIPVTLALYDLSEQQDEFTSSQGNDLANRLKKNYQKLEKWASREGLGAWRLYDADMPEYNAAIDVYNDYLVIQEYAPPKDIPANVANDRLWQLIDTLADTLPFSAEKMTLKVRRKQEGKQQYQKREAVGLTTQVHEYGANFLVNLSDYLDTGLFLDHRWARQQLAKVSKDKKVLNLFAYTCTASVHAALGGASTVTSVDLSKTYLDWGRDNFELNGIPVRQHAFVQADCLQWLRQQPPIQHYDVIFLDPPTFSNSKRMQDVLDTQRDHVELLRLAARVLKDDGMIFFSTNKRKFKLDEEGLAEAYLKAEDLTARSISQDFARNKGIHYLYKVTHNA